MLRNVLTKAIWDQRRGFVSWAVAAAGVTAIYASFYPSMQTPSMAKSMEAFSPKMLQAMGIADLSSAVGYLDGSVFALVVPLLVLVFAAGLAGRTLAADEETGTLDLLLAHPVGRTTLALQRLVAAALGVVVLGLGVWLALVAVNEPAELHLELSAVTGMVLHLVFLGWAFVALGFAVGAITGRRGHVFAAVACVGVISYACNTVVPMLDGMEWAEKASAFYYYAGSMPLRDGVDPAHAGVLLGATVVLAAAGTLVFGRRDIAT